MIEKLCAPAVATPSRSGRAQADAGFAAVDALVALSIIAVAMVLSFEALTQASRAASAALEVRRAETLLRNVLEAAPRTYDTSGGASGGFTWRVDTQATGAERPIAICRRAAALRHVASGRGYEASTLETCPPSEGL